MKKRIALLLAFLFYASLLPWRLDAACFTYLDTCSEDLIVKSSPYVNVRAYGGIQLSLDNVATDNAVFLVPYGFAGTPGDYTGITITNSTQTVIDQRSGYYIARKNGSDNTLKTHFAVTDNGVLIGGRTTNASPYGIIWKTNTYTGAVAPGGFDGKNTFMHDFSYGINAGGFEPIGNNTFLGMDAGNLHMGSTATDNSQSSYNTGLGTDCLFYNTTGSFNTGVGALAVSGNYTGTYNTGIGALSLLSNYGGDANTAVGFSSLRFIQNGGYNVAVGHDAGRLDGNGDSNAYAVESIYIGYNTRAQVSGHTDEIVIGSQQIGKGSNTAIYGSPNTTDSYMKGQLHLPDGGVVGTDNSGGAFAGNVGEYLDNTVAYSVKVSLTTATARTIASLTLTPGDWDVTGMVKFDMDNTTNVTRMIGGTSLVDNNWENNDFTNSQRFFPTAGQVTAGWGSEGIVVPTRRVSIDNTTTVYLYAYAVFTVSTANGYGFIRARRMR